MEKVIATGYPRLHLSLVDMAAASMRMYGGFGIALEAFPITAEAVPNDSVEIETSGFIEDRTKNNLIRALETARNQSLSINCKLKIHSDAKQHVGLGSSTQVILTALDAVAALNGWNISPFEIGNISGRGRTSMIGFSTHYFGGFCIDAGQKYIAKASYLPSHSPEERSPSLFIGSWDFPSHWLISLIGVESPIAMDTAKEREFISKNAPMASQSGLQSIAALYHGILPAVMTHDYVAFAESLEHIQLVGWNSIEFQLQSQETLYALKQLWAQEFVAALSSFGPIIVVIHSNEYTNTVKEIAGKSSLSYSGPYHATPKHSNPTPRNPYISSI